MLMFARN